MTRIDTQASLNAETSRITPTPRIAVIGVGAVGGFYAARLIRAGHDVHLLARSDYEALRNKGLSVKSFEGDFHLPPDQFHVWKDPHDLPPVDLAIVTIKATDNSAYEQLLHPVVGTNTTLLTLQNGLGNEDALVRLFGAEHVMGGMAFVCINRTAPGCVHHIDHGFLKIGEYQAPGSAAPGVSQRGLRIADWFGAAGIRVEVLPDLRRGRWDKLIWNIPFNGLGAALDLTTDRLLAIPDGELLVRRAMTEVVAIATAEGISLPADIIERHLAHTRTMGAYQSSMQVDRRMGRRLEVQAILGEPVCRARELGIDSPTISMIYDLARLVDASQTGQSS